MARLHSTETFTNGQTLYADDLTNHVAEASPLPDFIGLQSALNTAPASDDELLINDVDGGAVKKITVSNLTSGLPATTVASLSVSGNATVTGNATVNGNTTIGNSDTDTVTVNAESTFGGDAEFNGAATFNGNVTLGELAESGTYSRLNTVMTITKVDHGLTTSDVRWFNIANNQDYLGYYTVTVLTSSTFTITVVDDSEAPTTGTVYWYEKSTTLESPLAGAISGTPAVSLISTTDAYGDKVLIQDASDSDKLKVVAACLPKAWACISIRESDTTTVSATVSRTSPSNIATITKVAHGLKVGDVIYLDGATSSIVDDWYDIKSVPTADTFTVQTAATTNLSNTNLSWYALTVNGSGVSSAFKQTLSSTTAQINLSVPFTSTNYAVTSSFHRNSGTVPGHAVLITNSAFSDFTKTEQSFAVSCFYGSTDTDDGTIMLSVFGNI